MENRQRKNISWVAACQTGKVDSHMKLRLLLQKIVI